MQKHAQLKENLIIKCKKEINHESIKIEVKTELFNNKQRIYVCTKNKTDLPIFQPDKPLKIKELEEKGIKIASFLKVPIKGI